MTKFCAAALIFTLLCPAVSRTAPASASPTGCGAERVHIKQMADPDAKSVAYVPMPSSVDALRAAAIPAGYSSRNDSKRYPLELQVFDIRALLIGWKLEADRDYHLVIADPQHPADTMIAESIDPTCPLAKSSVAAAAFAGVRAAFARCRIAPTPSYHKFPVPTIVEIQGPAFFDVLHGQTGVAPNGIEIHPITVIRSIACPK